ncbi:hypothetical protein C8Q76DRAFT_633001 [Earliella scabrosa]|nr:hypothetical protein C8Q76DRAFT_633001 [Earliella scabrosa]
MSPHHRRTKSYRAYHEDRGTLVDTVHAVLGYMRDKKIDLPLLLWAMSYNVSELVPDETVKFERVALLSSLELPGLLKSWHKPPRSHGRGIRTKGAAAAVDDFVLDRAGDILDQEMAAVGEYMRTSVAELSAEALLSIKLATVKEEVKKRAPNTWKLLLRCAWTARQAKENKLKDPETVCYAAIDH